MRPTCSPSPDVCNWTKAGLHWSWCLGNVWVNDWWWLYLWKENKLLLTHWSVYSLDNELINGLSHCTSVLQPWQQHPLQTVSWCSPPDTFAPTWWCLPPGREYAPLFPSAAAATWTSSLLKPWGQPSGSGSQSRDMTMFKQKLWTLLLLGY